MDLLALQKPVNEVHRGLDRLWKQSELHLDYYEPVDEDFPIFWSEHRLPLKVASLVNWAILALEQRLMNIFDVVSLDQLSWCRHPQLIYDALRCLLEGLIVCLGAGGAATVIRFDWGVFFSNLRFHCRGSFLFNRWRSRIYWLEACSNFWFDLLRCAANLNYWSSFGAHGCNRIGGQGVLDCRVLIGYGMSLVREIRVKALTDWKSGLGRCCSECDLTLRNSGVFVCYLHFCGRYLINGRVVFLFWRTMAVKVNLTPERLYEYLTARWSLKRFTLLNCVESHGLLCGLWFLRIPAIFLNKVVFLMQWRSSVLTSRRGALMIIIVQAVAVIRMTLLKAGLILIGHCLIKVYHIWLSLVVFRCGFHAHSVLLSVSLVATEPRMNLGELRHATSAADLLHGASGVRLVWPGVMALLRVPARNNLANGRRRRVSRRTLIILRVCHLAPEMIHGWERTRVVEKGGWRRPLWWVRTH